MLNPARFLQGLIGAILLMACAASPARAADWNTLSGHVPKITSSLTPLGGVEADKPLRLAIGLPLRDGAGVQAFLAQLYDPASPGYRQFLTGQEFTARFGPTASDYEAVKRFAASNGLAVACEFSNRLVLDVTGPAGAVERA